MTANGAPDNPPPYGRQPTALRGLAESIQHQLERELRDAEMDDGVFVKAYWLRSPDSEDNYGWPDYGQAYVWVAPVFMNPKRCEAIQPFVARMRGVTQTGRGGDFDKNLRPFVYAVVDLRARQS
jgi:hypothetical protein